MGLRYNIIRRQTVERTWTCPGCGAHGVVVLRCVGESGWRRQSWWHGSLEEQSAREDAGWAVQRDAERIMALIRCPTCGERAPRAGFWSGVRLVPAVVVGLIASAVAATLVVTMWQVPIWLTPAIPPLAVWLTSYDERRRWREAKAAAVIGLKPGPIAKRLPTAVARVVAKALPAAPLEPIRSAAPEATEPARPDEGPRFLKGD